MTWTLFILITSLSGQPGEASPTQQLIQVDHISTRQHCLEIGQGISSLYPIEGIRPECISIIPKKSIVRPGG
jgi:hypothetical protein